MKKVFFCIIGALMSVSTLAEEKDDVGFAIFELGTASTFYSLVPIAHEAGIFEKHGINSHLSNHGDYSSEIAGIRNGDDHFSLNIYPVKEHPEMFVAKAALSTRMTASIVVRNDSGISSLADLGGKTLSSYGCGDKLGIVSRTLRDALTEIDLALGCAEGGRKENPDPNTVYITPGGSAGYVQMFRSDHVDGTVTMFADAQQLVAEGYKTIAGSGSGLQAGRIFLVSMLSAHREWAEANPDVVQRVRAALIETRERMWNWEWARSPLSLYVMHKPWDALTRKEQLQLAEFYAVVMDITPQHLCVPEWVAEAGIRYYSDDPELALEGVVDFDHCPPSAIH